MIHPEALRKPAVSRQGGGLEPGAKVLEALSAPFTLVACAALPTYSDPLADREAACRIAHCSDRSDELVARHERVGRDSKVVIDQVDVGVANSAVSDRYLDFVAA